MLSSGKYKSILSLEAKYDIFHEILSSFNRKMDFYFTASPSSFLCFQITWKLSLCFIVIRCSRKDPTNSHDSAPSKLPMVTSNRFDDDFFLQC
jgi:hypothetical protein